MKISKKIFSIVTSVLISTSIFSGIPLSSSAVTYSDKMQYGDYLYYRRVDEDEDGTYDYVEITYCIESESVTKVEIPSEIDGLPVTSIENAFYNGYFLKSINIPDSITSISYTEFGSCESLININVSENNENYCSVNGVLFNKDKTELIQYPRGNKRKEYIIPDSVTTIVGNAFHYCKYLKNIEIPDSVTIIGNYTFMGCSLTNIKIPNNVSEIGEGAFCYSESLTNINIPNNVSVIGNKAFSSCSSLTSITIENPDCEIIDNNIDNIEYFDYTISNGYDYVNNKHYYNGTIYGHENSTAQAYAEKHGMKFAVIGTEYKGVKGDANGDGVLRASDAAFIAKTLAESSIVGKKISVTEYPNADFNNDEKITASDAAAIAKYLAEQALKK